MAGFRNIILIAIFAVSISSCGKVNLDGKMSEAAAIVGIGKHAEALAIYEKVAKHCPDYPRCAEVLFKIADLEASSLGKYDSALATYSRIIELFPLREAGRIAHERSAAIYEQKNDYVGAAEEYAQLLRYFPKHKEEARYLLRLGESYLALGNFAQARIELEGMIDYHNYDQALREEAIFAYAESYFLEGRLGLAEQAYRRLIDEYPASKLVPEAQMKIATCQEERGLLGDATETMVALKKEYPNRPVIDDRLESMQKRGKERPPEADKK